MITIGSFKDICDEYDEIWLIVRSLKSIPHVSNTQVYHVPVLSPSPDLFSKYIVWRDNGEWNEDTFKNKYVPQFLQEMHSDEAQQTLNTLIEHGKTHKILLACYCRNESMCHRSIVMGIIQGMTNHVEEYCNDYSHYYNEFLKFNNSFMNTIQKSKWKLETTFYLLVAGSRSYTNFQEMCTVLDYLLQNQVKQHSHIVIVSGGARGADELAEKYADLRGYEKHIMPADWDKYGKSAGYRRNENMHLYISAPSDKKRGCVCFWDMKSKGTKHNFELSLKYGNNLRVFNTISHKFLTEKEIEGYT